MVKIKVLNMRAVGMHHHGPRELALQTPYIFKWEPTCPHDLGNAVGIFDHRGALRAYLTRSDAAVMAKLFHAGVVEGRVVGKTTTPGHVEKRELGPQQECNLVFKVAECHASFVCAVFDTACVAYTLM
jgi:hypothetical protein